MRKDPFLKNTMGVWVLVTFQIVIVFVGGVSYMKPTVTFEAHLCFVIFREENFHPFPLELNHLLVK